MTDTPTSTKITVAEILIELGYIKTRLDKLVDHDKRIKKIERVTWALSGVAALSAAILAPVAASAIKVWLGLP